MRRLLVDHARRRGTAKRGAAVTFDDDLFDQCADGERTEEVLAETRFSPGCGKWTRSMPALPNCATSTVFRWRRPPR
jgi:NADH pyrophosphatase NudC (nudix superfamily)